MYFTRNGITKHYVPKQVFIKKEGSVTLPIDRINENVENVSIEPTVPISVLPKDIIRTSKVVNIRIRPRKQRDEKPLNRKDKLPRIKYDSRKGLLIVATIILILAILVVLPTVLGVVLSRNPSIIDRPVANVIQTATWSFDGNANDLYSAYNGTLGGGATYSSGTYFGLGSSLILNNSLNSFVKISDPFFNLSYTSFTVEAWIFLTTTVGDHTVFSQCECGGCQDHCLSLTIRNGKMYMSFSLNVLLGTTTLLPATWYHIAFVYDYAARTQSVYLQGNLDGRKTSSDPYQGQKGAIFIGVSNLTTSFYHGFIDELTITTMAKSADNILEDATLVAYFSFDSSSLTNNDGGNKINGTLLSATAVAGKKGKALLFTGATSYFQVYAFYQLSQSNKEFSIALWINPNSASGTLIQKTRLQSSTIAPCSIFMTFSTLGQIVFSIPTTAASTVQIVGPFITSGQWTHLAYTYSPLNGIIMYINGARYGSTGNLSYFSWPTNYDWLNVAQFVSPCILPSVSNGYYQGAIDEFYIYRRELSASVVASLANY